MFIVGGSNSNSLISGDHATSHVYIRMHTPISSPTPILAKAPTPTDSAQVLFM